MCFRKNRLIRYFTRFLIVSELIFQGIGGANVLGTIYSNNNDTQDFLAHVACLDTASITDCCVGARRALAALSFSLQEEECEKHLSLVPTQDQRTMYSLSFPSKQINATGWTSPKEGIVQSMPHSFLWDDTESKMILHNKPLKEVMTHLSTEASSSNSEPVTICIESSFSGSGMHREINYKVHADRELKSLDILVHLPADVFVNKEDAFGHNWNTQPIVIVTTEPVDLEEPTFASPPHALLLRLGETRPDASFSLKIHLRYPTPLETGDFQRIILSPALGLSATVEGAENVAVLADNTCAHPIELWAASGHVDDAWVVLVATVGLALVGAAVMLSDLSKVTVWL